MKGINLEAGNIEIRTHSMDETVEAGVRLGSLLDKGDLLCLYGNLGTGKTAFTSGIARALDIHGYITSPTFTIVNEYKGKMPLYHFDVYRIADPEEMFEIGFEEYIGGEGVVVVEWAELIEDILPRERIRVQISKDLAAGLDTRVIRFEFSGDRYKDYESKWMKG